MTDYEVHTRDDLMVLLNCPADEIDRHVEGINEASVRVNRRPPITKHVEDGITVYWIDAVFLRLFRNMRGQST